MRKRKQFNYYKQYTVGAKILISMKKIIIKKIYTAHNLF